MSIVFGPNFLRPEIESVETVLQIPDVNTVTVGIFMHATKILESQW